MVNHSDPLGVTFGALAAPLRRDILTHLSLGEQRVSDLAARYDVSGPAVSRHLRVLESAGLLVRTRVGREHILRSNPAPILMANNWMASFAAAWVHQFARIDALLAKEPFEHRASGDPHP